MNQRVVLTKKMSENGENIKEKLKMTPPNVKDIQVAVTEE